MKPFFLLLLFLQVTSLSSQILEISDKSLDAAVFTVNLMNRNYDSAIGTPYINDEFLPAKINNSTVTQLVRFNCTDDEVEVMQKNNKILLLDLEKNQKIALSDGSERVYHIYKFRDEKNKSQVTFLELIKEAKPYRLYKKERKRYIPNQNAEGYREATPEEFVSIRDIYFITDFISNNDGLLEIPVKKKNFFSFFGKYRKLLENFAKSQKLDYQDSKDLIEIVDFYFQKTEK